MDLDSAKIDSWSQFWARVGMLVCFAVAAAILLMSVGNPSTARAGHPDASQGGVVARLS